MVSVAPPAGNGTITRTGRVGYAVCASAAPTSKRADRPRVMNFIQRTKMLNPP